MNPEGALGADIALREYSRARSVPLDSATGRALAASGVLESAVPDPHRDGHWLLRAGSLVGAVRIRVPEARCSLTVRIAPKTPVRRLFFLLGFSLDPAKAWRSGRDGTVDAGAYEDVLPALAHAVERQIDTALRQGVLQGYRRVEESALVLRGRIREAEQIRRHFGRTPPVEISYDAYTADIPENRILRGAAETLLRLPGVPGPVRRRLAHHRVRLVDAEPLVRGHALPAWQPSRLNTRYQPALRLAEALLTGTSPEHRPGELRLDGFLFDMNTLFEDFVTAALREAVREYGLTARLQDRHHLDTVGRLRIRPDLVVYAADGRTPVGVVDAKYKTEKTKGYPSADLYQMLAYCTVLGLDEGHLVYAAGRTDGHVHEVRGSVGPHGQGVRLHQHALDLNRGPDELLADFRDLAARLAEVPTRLR
ncbi:McrC family protein [Kitasatospora sp. NBC_00240]|uniref:McrC family protein n=1 Tax=Kitasatospora sp. NBC_00240 TaxID=2903567 RepID=UPI00225311F1|nr:restriction endonuclease [Kitasatospora sp. NBC_00240]MCX5210080.1 McrC family protein [Kitasatospora sp. NBC_00240]